MAMAQFKRARLFSNISTVGPDNIIYDEVWVYKLTTDNGTIKQKYRIRYQRTDNAMALGFEADEVDAANAMLEQFGPAISCTLEVWERGRWSRCLDWMGDPGASADTACHDLNEQFKAFVTCVPIEKPFTSDIIPPRGPGKKKKTIKPSNKKDDYQDGIDETKINDVPDDGPDFTWI